MHEFTENQSKIIAVYLAHWGKPGRELHLKKLSKRVRLSQSVTQQTVAELIMLNCVKVRRKQFGLSTKHILLIAVRPRKIRRLMGAA